MKKEDPTIATLLKAQGYVTGQFGKNHLGDRDEMLPTAHGFDEFFGNLYHLNAEEEPEHPDYPKNPEFKKKFGPRGVIHSFADGRIEDTGPLTRKRMETIDEEVTAKALDFMERAKKADKPFFLWWNSTRMHIFTHLKAASQGKTGLGIYADGMVEHDGQVGQVLAKLKELGLDENTIVMYSTDNGAETFTWPDGGTTMFRGEKNTQWEGGYRVPGDDPLARRHQARHGRQRHRRARGHAADAARRRRRRDRQGGPAEGPQDRRARPTRSTSTATTCCPALEGKASWPRHEFIYWTDDGSVAALRYDNWKVTFLKQNAHGLHVWIEPFEELRAPLLTNLRMDPVRAAPHEIGMDYDRWFVEHMFVFAPGGRLRRPVAAELPRVPAAPEAGQLQPRPRDGGGDRRLQAVKRTR